jgi:hypothetical protein
MGRGSTGRIPGSLGKALNLGGPLLKRPEILNNPRFLALGDDASAIWTQVVDFVDPPKLRRMLGEIYGSERWADASDADDTSGSIRDPANARLPSKRRERDARRPTQNARLRLKDPKFDFAKGVLNGEASFVLEIPSPYGDFFDSPTLIRVRVSSPKIGSEDVSVKGSVRVAAGLVGANFNVRLHFDPMDVLKAAVAIAKDKGIEKEVLEQLLSKLSIDVSAFAWVLGLPTWSRLSTSSLLPVARPLLGTKDRLLPVQIGAMPDSSMFLVGAVPIPKGVFFDTVAPAAGVHYSDFGRESGFSLTAGLIVKPNLEQMGKDWGRMLSFFGYADLYYVKRVSDTVDLGFGLTYAVDPFSSQSDPGPAYLHYMESKHKPWLPTSSENVAPSEDRAGHRIMFKITGTHNAFGG